MSALDCKYSILIKEVRGLFYLFCEPLSLVTEGSDLLLAYAEMKALQQKTLERFEILGIMPPEPFVHSSTQSSVSKQSSFPVKIFMGVGICLILLIGIGLPAVSAINQIKAPLKSIRNKYEMLSNRAYLLKSLGDVANTLKEITPQRKSEIRENLRIIVNEAKPFVDEIRPLLFETQNFESTLSQPLLENGNSERNEKNKVASENVKVENY